MEGGNFIHLLSLSLLAVCVRIRLLDGDVTFSLGRGLRVFSPIIKH